MRGNAQCLRSVGVCHLVAVAIVQKDKPEIEACSQCASHPSYSFPEALLSSRVHPRLQHYKTAVLSMCWGGSRRCASLSSREVDRWILVSQGHFVPLTQGLVSHSGSLNLAGPCCCCPVQMQSTDLVSSLRAQGLVWRILVEVQWGTHISLLRGRLGLGSRECWVLSTLPRDPPQSGQGQCLMLVTQQLLG